MRTNAAAWLCLVGLTAVTFLSGRFPTDSIPGALLIMAAAKSLLVAWLYMELREAHALWRVLFAFYLAAFVGLAFLLSRIA